MKRLTCAVIAAAIAGFNSPANAQSLHVDGAVVAKSGTGRTAVVLIPGLGGGSYVWQRVTAELAARYTVYSLTFPGFDGTPPIVGPYLPAFERAVTDLIANEHLHRPILVGHSLGGHVALAIAAAQPASVAAVVAVDALPLFPPAGAGDTALPTRTRHKRNSVSRIS